MAESTSCLLASRLLSVLYVVAGSMKVYPIIDPVYKHLFKGFVEYADVFPGRAIGFSIQPKTYMQAVGITEMVLGLGLLLGPRKVKVICTESLAVIMVGAMYSHARLGKYQEILVPATFLAGLAFVWWNYSQDVKRKQP